MDYIALVALIVSALSFGYTAWRDRKMDARVKQVENEQRQEAERAKIQRSKASAPYFAPSPDLVQQVYELEDGNLRRWHVMQHPLLTSTTREVRDQVPDGTRVALVLDNSGKGARRIKISGDMADLQLHQEPDIDSATGRVFLTYTFRRELHGKVQHVEFQFETEDGLELTHVYEIQHGHFHFRRIDPA